MRTRRILCHSWFDEAQAPSRWCQLERASQGLWREGHSTRNPFSNVYEFRVPERGETELTRTEEREETARMALSIFWRGK